MAAARRPGKVWLVGAGPGDPELLTLKGRRALAAADVVLHDHLANDALLDHAPPAAERIYVGKKKADHALAQDEIEKLMVEYALAGKTVVRLKGGDPYLFGRGGEEAEALVAAGIDFEVVPGVTVPAGLAAYTGVPLTHREQSSVVTFVTGHDPARIDWGALAASAETIVVFMGLTTLDDFAARLIAAGRDPQTPAMAVRWATRPDQRTVVAPLAELASRVREARLKPPATIVIGNVVSLRPRLSWFERLPLLGRRVVVTRAAEQAPELAALLSAAGAEPVLLPVIELVPAAIGAVDPAAYDWLIFTSVNGVRYFAESTDIRTWPRRIAAIGTATAEAVRRLHVTVDVVPESFDAEGLAAAFAPFDMQGARVLLARAAEGRDVVPESLHYRGARVDAVAVYRNVVPPDAPARARALFSAGTARPDWVTFTSSSTVKNLLSMVNRDALAGVKFASIGPATSETMRKHALPIDAEAEPHTMEGLVAALISASIGGS